VTLVSLAVATGCAAVSANSGGTCDAARAQSLIGQPAGSAAAAQARKLSGARVVRFLRPGQVVTMEYLAGRLNLVLDDRNRIRTVRCG
jgi:hypothetical protein